MLSAIDGDAEIMLMIVGHHAMGTLKHINIYDGENHTSTALYMWLIKMLISNFWSLKINLKLHAFADVNVQNMVHGFSNTLMCTVYASLKCIHRLCVGGLHKLLEVCALLSQACL